jgi:hypothetical protein
VQNLAVRKKAGERIGGFGGLFPGAGSPPVHRIRSCIAPWLYSPDASIFKVFPIREGMNLRVNADAFNAFSVQGNNAANSNGIQYFPSSHNAPRQIQISAHFSS